MWLVERMSNVVILKWVFSWEWGVVKVALELVPTSGGMFGSDTSPGDTESPGYSALEHSCPHLRCDLQGNFRAVN